MTYILNDGPDRGRGQRNRPVLLAAAAAALVALLVVVFLVGRSSGGSGEDTGFAAPAPGAAPIRWSLVGSQPVPESPMHGPAEVGNGLAAGFTRDELGAVLAAINISTRLSSAAGPIVYETTARLQCVGDIGATVRSIQGQRSDATAGSTTPTEMFFQTSSGEPKANLVTVSIAMDTPQSRGMGGYAELRRTVQWVDGDWKLLVPPPPPQLISSVTNYTSLGRPDAA